MHFLQNSEQQVLRYVIGRRDRTTRSLESSEAQRCVVVVCQLVAQLIYCKDALGVIGLAHSAPPHEHQWVRHIPCDRLEIILPNHVAIFPIVLSTMGNFFLIH